MSSVLSELTCLAINRPAIDAPASVVAGYYAALAAVHEHLAAEAHNPAERDRERTFAASARRHAARLLTPAPTKPLEALS